MIRWEDFEFWKSYLSKSDAKAKNAVGSFVIYPKYIILTRTGMISFLLFRWINSCFLVRFITNNQNKELG